MTTVADALTTGYLDRLSVSVGETLAVMATTPAEELAVDVVRIRSGDCNPAGPGFRVLPVADVPVQHVPGRIQHCHPGSFMLARGVTLQQPPRGPFTVAAWAQPTLPDLDRSQGIIGVIDAGGNALVLGLASGGAPALIRRDADGSETVLIRLDEPLRLRTWMFLAATIDLPAGRAELHAVPRRAHDGAPARAFGAIDVALPTTSDEYRVLVAATGAEGLRPQGCYNGKIEAPTILARGLSEEEMVDLAVDRRSLEHLPGRVAAWRFEAAAGPHIPEATGRGPTGELVNAPTQLVTGRRWDGTVLNPAHAPEQYGAVHFHDDDLDDARWDVDARIAIPANLASGLYAVRLQVADATDYLPFVVRPAPGVGAGRVLVLLSTFTYLAYGNERLINHVPEALSDHAFVPGWHDEQLELHPEYAHSIYDKHTDGSGICFSSYLRPILNMRPDYRCWLQEAPRNFSGDLYLFDWLEEQGREFDVITDHDLHALGAAALVDHDVVTTVSHPEYVSGNMLDALQEHLGSGGSLLYLGGNGFYWVTSQDPYRPHLVEVRRGYQGTRTWESAPGENYHSTTGEPGGLWRFRGRAPNTLVGVGFAAMGWDAKAPGFRRTPDSRRPEAAFIFDGIEDEVLGDFGLVLGGACGDEVDRYDEALGSPHEALVVATSTGHSDYYLQVIEDIPTTHLEVSGTKCDDVRADLVLWEQPAGGAVFSASAMSFLGSLPYNGYDNNVSRLLANVIDNFCGRPGKQGQSGTAVT